MIRQGRTFILRNEVTGPGFFKPEEVLFLREALIVPLQIIFLMKEFNFV
jgi:hypothetical protein